MLKHAYTIKTYEILPATRHNVNIGNIIERNRPNKYAIWIEKLDSFGLIYTLFLQTKFYKKGRYQWETFNMEGRRQFELIYSR